MNAEQLRLIADTRREQYWRRWGPYLSERAWGTVREDYSADGRAWEYFPFEHAHLRAYRWGEDGIAGICDNHQRLCFALAFWNGRDPILKERLFGLSGDQGNHGEDVKECYYYLDSTPTHSYMKCLYKYPQAEFPYARLLQENQRRGHADPEFELIDTGVFDQDRYFDVFVEYAKAEVNDILIRITVTNRGPDAAPLHLLPTLWFRNHWSWGKDVEKPVLSRSPHSHGTCLRHRDPGTRTGRLSVEHGRLPAASVHRKRHRHQGHVELGRHTRRARLRQRRVSPPRDSWRDRRREPVGTRHQGMRLVPTESGAGRNPNHPPAPHLRTEASRMVHDVDGVFAERICEADEFYSFAPDTLSADGKRVQRQAFAGLLWSKQYYHFVVADWLKGDPGQPKPPASRLKGRDSNWVHIYNEDVISMPDNWEYPWYAAWDLAFHMIPLALVDPDNAKAQLKLFLREWYMHPNGQIPAYEWAFGDVNPPVHAWACWRVFTIDKKLTGRPDYEFLETVFHKLLMNFTWWVNRKDSEGNNIFEGGFLGLDNIGVFDRSKPLPGGGVIEQSDGTSWMAMYCLNMLRIALELASKVNMLYEDIANKFFEHFLYIANAINGIGGKGLWDRGRRLLLRPSESAGWAIDPHAGALRRRRHPAVCRGHHGIRSDRIPAGLSKSG